MKKTVILLTVLALPLGAAVALAHHGPETVTIDAAKDKKAAVEFPHAKHQEMVDSCVTCHHTQEGLTVDSDIEVKACTTCHLDPEEETTPSMREMSVKKNPFHIVCIDCHKEQEKGPSKCNDCHPKE